MPDATTDPGGWKPVADAAFAALAELRTDLVALAADPGLADRMTRKWGLTRA
jgi:hypothetical protein